MLTDRARSFCDRSFPGTWCPDNPLAAPTPKPAVEGAAACHAGEYCSGDIPGKHVGVCAQPMTTTCDPKNGDKDCAAHPGLSCDPFVGLCVIAGANCTTPHAQGCHAEGDFCSPVSLHCVTPTQPGTHLCAADTDCAAPATCTPLTADVHVCGVVAGTCWPSLATPTVVPKET